MARRRLDYGVIIDWDESQVREFIASPNGELGRTLMTALGEVVLAGAKRRALRRTGRMIDAMRTEVGRDEQGVYTDVVSPVRDPDTGFPYAIVHEGKKVRDRRPHRSLRPALRDIRHIETR